MSLLLIGLNHKTAALETREQLALSQSECAALLPELVNNSIVREALILSTCNRVEVLIEGDSPEQARAHVIDFLAASKNISITQFADHLYSFTGAAAVHHLFRVAASLDSMVIGETQILGQVRSAYKIASEARTANRVLHKLLHHAFHAAKRVRTETNVGSNAVSVASAAVEAARKIFKTLTDKTVLLIGAGEMAELAAKHLIANGAGQILIANRTYASAAQLALEFAAEVVALEDLNEVLPQADVIISSTAAPKYLITAEMVKKSQEIRKKARSLFVDISVPRNIEPEIASIKNVSLYAIDNLETIVSANLDERRAEAGKAEEIVKAEVAEFWNSLQSLNFGENLGLLRQKMQETARQELNRQRSKLGNLSPAQEAAFEQLLVSTVNKLAHPLLYGLRQSHQYGAIDYAETLCSLMINAADEKESQKTEEKN